MDFTVTRGSSASYDYNSKIAGMKPLAGVGDKAVYDPSSTAACMVVLTKGKDEIMATFSGPKGNDPALIKGFVEKIFKHL